MIDLEGLCLPGLQMSWIICSIYCESLVSFLFCPLFSLPVVNFLKGYQKPQSPERSVSCLLVFWNFVGTGKLLTLPSSVVPKHMLQRCEVVSSVDPLCLNRNKGNHAGRELQQPRVG